MSNEKCKILIVEDNNDHLELIKISLEKTNDYELTVAKTLDTANSILENINFDLVITDIKLPDGDSIEYFKSKKLFNKHHVIAMTSFGDEHRAVNALKSGAKDYIVKDAHVLSNMGSIVKKTLRDVISQHEKRKIETALRKSEKKYRTLFENASDGIFIMNSKFFIECNEKALKVFGLETKEELIGKTPGELSPENQYNGENSSILAEKILKEIAKKKKIKRFLWKHIRGDGTPFDAEISLNPFKLEGELHFNGIIKDITLKLQAEQKLRTWESIFRHSQWGIIITNSTGVNISMLNTAIANILKYEEKELYNLTIQELFPKNIRSIADVIIDKTKINNYFNTESSMLKKNGESFPVLINSFIMRDKNDQPIFYVLNIQDITERKHTEKLEREVELAKRSSKMKQQFLANMSHEIRTPLNSMLGFIELLKETELTDTQQDYLSTIDESSNILLSLINDILDFSKIEAGKLKLHPQTVDICSVFQKIRSFFEYTANQKGLQLELQCPTVSSFFVKIDETRLLQIVSNLVSNAIKFTHKGRIIIRLIVSKIVKDHIYFRVEIEDTGIGIKEENRLKLFKAFSQLNEKNITNFKGTGLGLAISRQLATLMKGEIGVESEYGKGSLFWFTFAAEKSKELTKVTVNETSIDLKNLNLKLNVLLAEDKILNQKMAAIMITNAGCSVDIANNGLEVLEKFEEGKYDIIFMDIHMPQMDGITALKELKSKYKKLPPVIGLSASAMEGDAEKYMKEGLDDYLAKPVQPKSIYSKLIQWSNKE